MELTPEIEQGLAALAEQTGRTIAYCLRETIERRMENVEDYYLAHEALAHGCNEEERSYSAVDVRKRFGVKC